MKTHSKQPVNMKTHSTGLALAIAGIIAFNPLNLRADITTGLVGWWTFDETSGETAVDSAGVLNLNGTHQPTGAGPTVNQLGRVGSAYYFDGVNDVVKFFGSAGAGLIPATGDFSFFVWFNMPGLITTVGGQGLLLSCNNGQVNRANNGIQNVSGTNRANWFFNGGISPAVYYGDPLTTNVWYLLGVSRSNNVFIGWFNTNGYVLGTATAPISTAADWVLGRQINGTSFFRGRVDDLRVYNRAMTPADVLELYSQPSGLGSLQSVSLELVRTQMVTGTFQQAHAFAAFAQSPRVELTLEGGITYSSSDTNVVSVSAQGLLTALNLGTATVSVTYSNQTVSTLVTVVPLATKLIHRYSFTADAHDAVGTNDGTLYGSAAVAGGVLVLSSATPDYVDLGPNAITGSDQLTFEAWASFGTNANWCRLFDFGDNDSISGTSFVYVTPHTDTGNTRVCINGGAGQQDVAEMTGTLDSRTNVYVAAVYHPLAGYMQLYLNGLLVAQNTNVTRDLATVVNNYSFLGKSQFAANPGVNMSLDEFRVYQGVLDRTNVAINVAAGPNNLVTNPGPVASVSLALASPLPEWASAQADLHGDFANVSGVSLLGFPGVSFTSSDTNVATVNGAGVVRCVAAGSATITGSYSGQSASQTVIVSPVTTRRVLVSCISNNIVLAYDSKGTNWQAAGTFAAGTYAGRPLTMPQAIAQDGSGAVYLGEEMYGGRILKFTTAGAFLGVVATGGIDFSGPPQFLTLGPDANLYMAICFTTNASDMIDKVTLPGGQVSTNVPTTDTLHYTFSTPRGLAFGSDGYLYVANRGANKILKFDTTNGTYVADFVSITTPNAFIWDAPNSRFLVSSLNVPAIQAIDTSGVTSVIFNDGGSHSIIGLLTLGTNVFFTDFNNGFVAQVTGTNTFRTLFAGLTRPAVMMALSLPESVSLTVQDVGGNVVLSWPGSGSLQQSDEVAGSYTDVPNATSPYTASPAATKKFFRVKVK